MKAVERVKQALAQNGENIEIMMLEQSTHTAQQAASALKCDIAQIVKSLIFKTAKGDKPVLALVSGDKRLDNKKLAHLVGEKLGKADADFVKAVTGFTIGGVAPVGSLEPLSVYMDETLLVHEHVWAAAGHPKSIFRINPTRLAQITAATVTDLT